MGRRAWQRGLAEDGSEMVNGGINSKEMATGGGRLHPI